MTMRGMEPGLLRHRVKLQKPDETQDAAGQPIPAWTDVATVYARVEAVGGGERWLRFKVDPHTDTMVQIRYRSDIKPSWRIVHEGRNLNVLNVLDAHGHKREQHCFCKEVVV